MKAAILIIFLAITVIGQQSGTVSGRVYWGVAGESGVPAAAVTLTSTDDAKAEFTASADPEGYFRIENVPPGEYVLQVAGGPFAGATHAEKAITVRSGDQLSEAIFLDIAPIRETVTVAADAPQSFDEVSKTVDVIDGREMRERADITLADSLRTIPGFRVQQLGGFGRTTSVKARGLRNQDTAVLIDGVRLRDAASITGDATAFLGDLTLTSVRRVEVMRGPGSSLYGTNAIGGTIDLRTPEPQPGLHGQVSAAFGGYGMGRFRGNISDGTADGRFGFNLAVARTAYTKGIDGQDNAHNTNFQSRIEFRPSARTNISARFFVSDAFVRLNSDPDTLGALPPSNAVIIDARPGVNFAADVNDPDNFQQSQFFNGQAVLTHTFGDKLVFEGRYSGLKTSRKNDSGPLGTGFQSASTSIFEGTIQTASGRFDWAPNTAHHVTAGYEFEHEKFGNDGMTPDGFGNFFTRAYQSSHTVYLQDQINVMSDKLQIAGGVRAQIFSLGRPGFSLGTAPYTDFAPDAPPAAMTADGSVSYFFERSGTKLRAHAGTGYRVPSLYERFGTFYSSFGTPGFIALGDPVLKPERAFAFDAGVEQDLFGTRARLSATYFYTDLDETIGYGNVVPPIGTTERPFGGYISTKGGTSRGGEFSGRVRASSSTDIFASYTFTNSDQRVPQVTGSGVHETLGVPAHQFTLTATQRFRRAWVNLDLLATSSYLAPIFDSNNFTFQTYIYRFKGNRRADLTAGYTIPIAGEKYSFRIFGTIENLLNYEYFENGFQTIGRSGRAGLSFGF